MSVLLSNLRTQFYLGISIGKGRSRDISNAGTHYGGGDGTCVCGCFETQLRGRGKEEFWKCFGNRFGKVVGRTHIQFWKVGQKYAGVLLIFFVSFWFQSSSQWSSFSDERLSGLTHQSTIVLQLFVLLSTASSSSAPAANTGAYTECCVITTKMVVTTNY